MSTTSNALTGKSSRARSVCGTYAGRPGSSIVPRRTGSSPSSARKSVVLPPPLGPSTPTISPAPGDEADVAQRVRTGDVAAREPLDPHAHAGTARARSAVAPATAAKTPPPSTASAGPAPTLSASAR